MKSGKVVLGLLAGLAAGAVLGVLFAPDKGEKTRKKISGKAKDARDSVKKAAKDLSKKAEELKDMALDKINGTESTNKQKTSSSN